MKNVKLILLHIQLDKLQLLGPRNQMSIAPFFFVSLQIEF